MLRSVLLPIVLTVTLLLVPSARPQGYPPDVAVRKMKVPEGLVAKLFASEPEVRQPILVKCDDRGRLWTIQFLQYPNPAGLKRVKVDRWSRTVYDRVPEPPPKGPRGDDRITILEDSDGDGRADRAKDFVRGLNLATGLAFGHGGVYVLQVPYLLFYPDRDGDDVPDGDPEVLLSGFGMEDAQSLANHLTWGPDGWLYGLNGSTTTCNIRGIEFQQGVWRYHPLTKAFELFCEGGGNIFGLTFDANGNLFYSSNGGYLFFHGVQGAYYLKNFGKHGPLHNLYAYGYFADVKKPAIVTRGPTTGGTVYLGNSFPDRFRGTFMSGDFLGHTASFWDVRPRGSTFAASPGGLLLDSQDTWFGATDVCYGPDGAVYVSDFFDRRTAHPDPDAQWDRSNGRIYRIEAKGTKPVRGLELAKRSSHDLVGLLGHRNAWYAERARVLLAGRRDISVWPELRALALQEKEPALALQGLWALYVSGGFDDEAAARLVKHPYEYVRSWTVRLLGDARKVSPDIARELAELARAEPSVVVRSQLASTARRLPGPDGLPVVEQLLRRNLDAGDPHVPLLLWWALEGKSVSERELVLKAFARPEAWDVPMNHDNLRRLVRRYAAEGTAAGYDACTRLLAATPTARRDGMLAALSQGLSERSAGLGGVGFGDMYTAVAAVEKATTPKPARSFAPLTAGLRDVIVREWQAHPSEPIRLRLALRAGIDPAYRHVLHALSSGQADAEQTKSLLALLEESGRDDCVPVVLRHVGGQQPEAVQLAALAALGRFGSREIADRLLEVYPSLSAALRSRARDVLLSRPASTRALLERVDAKKITAAEVPLDQVRRVALHGDEALNTLVRKHWGNVQPGTPEEKLAVMRRLSNDLRAAAGQSARGKALFTQHCATCHKLFGEGNTVGPDLTNTSRGDREYLLTSLVDPSAVIRKEYLNYVVTTTDGLVLTGLIAEQDAASLTVLDAKNVRTRLPRTKIEEVRESPLSLMPEKLLEQLSPQELRDLFAYVQGTGK